MEGVQKLVEGSFFLFTQLYVLVSEKEIIESKSTTYLKNFCEYVVLERSIMYSHRTTPDLDTI